MCVREGTVVAIFLRKCLVIWDCLELTTTTITSHPYPLNAKKPAVKDEPQSTHLYTLPVLCGWGRYHSQVKNTYKSLQKYEAQKQKGRRRS